MLKQWLSVLSALALIFVVFSPHAQAHTNSHNEQDIRKQLEEKADTSLQAREMLELINKEGGNSVRAAPMIASSEQTNNDEDEGLEVIQNLTSIGELPPTGYVPQDTVPDKKFTLTLQEGDMYLGKGVLYTGFTIDGKIPGPTLIVNQNDIVEIEVVNTGAVPHGMSIHAAYTQTSKYVGQIDAHETKSVKFKASYPGVYMYHCAPGGHAIPMHTLFGQYGMIVVLPDEGYEYEKMGIEPDLELYLIQHEIYDNGKDAISGDPLYVLFNGQIFRYLDAPIKVNPGDNVRIYFLNIGPNIISTFHIVGIVWDHVYWQGHPENLLHGGQTVLAGPSDSWVIDFRIPEDEGNYLMVTHAFGSATRGAIGTLSAQYDHEETDSILLADGPSYSEEELKEFRSSAERIISPYEVTDNDKPFIVYPGQDKVDVEIIGNSFSPKVLKVPVGTEVEWTNEDVFTFFEGEYSGAHDVATTSGPEMFASPLLGHGESFSYTFTEVGEYEYICTPHPYMKAKVIVYDPDEGKNTGMNSLSWILLLAGLVVIIIVAYFYRKVPPTVNKNED